MPEEVKKVKVEIEIPEGYYDLLQALGKLHKDDNFVKKHLERSLIQSLQGELDEDTPLFDEGAIKRAYNIRDDLEAEESASE